MQGIQSAYRFLPTGIALERPSTKSLAKAEKLRGVSAEHSVLFTRRQEGAMLADIVDALPVGTEALEVRHVGAPYQLGCAEQITHLADEFLRLWIWILPDAAQVIGNMISISRWECPSFC